VPVLFHASREWLLTWHQIFDVLNISRRIVVNTGAVVKGKFGAKNIPDLMRISNTRPPGVVASPFLDFENTLSL
jgi:hypothetical protein